MTRALFAVVTLACLCPPLPAAEKVLHFGVQPMAAPKPALKYQLLPEVEDMQSGNAAHEYLRCFAEQRIFFFSRESAADRARFLSLPLADLAKEQLQGYRTRPLQRADWAARLDVCDWMTLRSLQADGTDLLLPELGPLAILGEALHVRFRGQVARREYGDAINTAKTMFALARHLGEHPAGSASLLGISIGERAIGALEEMVQQPGSPNLYWALTQLPCPLVDIRKGVQGDRALVVADLRPLRTDAVMTPEQLEEVTARLSGRVAFLREQAGQPPRNFRAELKAKVADAEAVGRGRERLVAAGIAGALVKDLAPAQVVLLDAKEDYQTQRDDSLKLLGLPIWQIELPAVQSPRVGDGGLFGGLVSRVLDARRAQVRLEQRLALLRCVEALRLSAAGHEGRFPESSAAADAPLPDDPFTGKPFAYELRGATARVCGHGEAGERNGHDHGVCYEITVRKN
jgi:hypothetical protein